MDFAISGNAVSIKSSATRSLDSKSTAPRGTTRTTGSSRNGSASESGLRKNLQGAGTSSKDKENFCRLNYAGWNSREEYEAQHGELGFWPNGLVKKTRKNAAEFGLFYWSQKFELEHQWSKIH